MKKVKIDKHGIRIPMPPPTRMVPMKKRAKLDKIAKKEMHNND